MELSVRRLFLPGGTYGGGPYELRLPIFLQPLGGALKNRSAAPAAHLKRPRRGLFAAGTYSDGRCCSNPPLRRFTNFQIKQKLQCHYNTGVLGGRGWITQAAHLKRPRRGLFAAGTYSDGRCCSNPPLRRFTNFQIKQKLQCHYNTGVLGGRGWITQAALLKTA